MRIRHPGLWWGPPKNFDDRKQQRKISWLELFYDLVYVAAIGQITHHLSGHLHAGEIAYSLLLFSLIFWSWLNGSQYYDLHGSEGIRTRLVTFWQMLAVAAVSITLQDTFHGIHVSFAISFAVIQILITYLWWSVGFYDPSHRVLNFPYTLNYLLALGLLVISIFTPAKTATLLWIVVLLLNLSPPITGAPVIIRVLRERGQVFSASEAIVERFGLFTIIVLAESILGTIGGTADLQHKTGTDWMAFSLGILISFLLWSLYFDMTSEQETKKGYWYMQCLIFLHFPLLGAFSVAGACLRVLLASDHGPLNTNAAWYFSASIAVVLLSIVGLTHIMQQYEEDRSYIRPVSRLLYLIAVLLLLVPLGTAWLKTTTYLILVTILLLIPVVIGIRSWVRYRFSPRK